MALTTVDPLLLSTQSQYTGFKNRLFNALGIINQRGYVSGTATTGANQYTVDRWRVVTSGQNLTFSITNNVTTFTAPAGGVEQVIEGLNLNTGTYVLSWTGTATATVGGVSIANGGTVSVTGGTNTTVRFIGGTFTYPQFELGTQATSFDYRPYGTELMLCQRYYENSNGAGGALSAADAYVVTTTAASSSLYPTYSFKVGKRGATTIAAVFAGGTGATFVVGQGSFYQNSNNSVVSTFGWAASAEL